MKKLFTLTLFGLFASFSSFAQTPIMGTLGACIGSSSDVYVDSLTSGGGTWSSSNTAIASVASSGYFYATVTGVSAGIATITYTLGGSYVTASFTVSPIPAAITGTTTLCAGTTSTLSDASTGGTWSSPYGTWVATVGSGTGIVTGVSSGTTPINYYINPGCSISTTVTINATPIGYITGPWSMCVGSSTTLSETLTGGTWSSSNSSIATIDISSGVATGVSAGTVNFSYTVTGICGPASARDTVTVNSTTVTGTISGPSSVVVGADITLSDAVIGGGTWSSSNTSVATIDPSSGVVTGLSTGTTTISYSVTGCSGLAAATTTVTVTALDGISGHVLFSGGGYYGNVRIWLINYNPVTLNLEAIDSMAVSAGGASSVYYQFSGLSTDSFRVKASVSFDTSYVTTGYVPTYHDSSFYWHDASVIYHTSGTSDINENINMAAGLITPGPGFIGGDVFTGANKGTSGSPSPVVGLLIYAIDATTGTLVQQTYTDATGSYSFSGLPYGSYLVHPELINYTTVPYTGITLSAAGATKTGASFIEHTVSHTITPGNVGVSNLQTLTPSIVAFPNPTSGKLNIAWNETANEAGNVSISDITGREVYKSTIQMNAGSGISQVDLSTLTNGLYIISVKSGNINYNNKIQVQH